MLLNSRATRWFLTVAALAGGGALVAGCGSSTGAGSAATGSVGNNSSHRTLSLKRAADISSDAAGYKLNMVMAETLSNQTINISATGSYTPKSHAGALTMDVSLPPALGGQQQFQVVMSKGAFYMKFPSALANDIPGARPWLEINLDQVGRAANMPGLGSLIDSTSTLNDPGEYLDFLRAAAAGSVTDVGQQTIAGVQTTHYEASVDFSKLPDALPSADRQSVQQLVGALQQRASVPDIPVDVWIDGSDLVRRIMMNMNETVEGNSVDTQMTENFSDYGAQPAPTIPSPADTTNLMSYIKLNGG